MKKVRKIFININKREMWKFILCFLCSMYITVGMAVCAQEDPIYEAKKSIVEIYSGFKTDDGVFYQLQHASGFVICNESECAYVVTTLNTLKNSDEKKKSYCKENGISTGNQSLSDAICVVVKGDVTTEATVLTESKKENYCILQIDGGISEKIPAKLGETEDIKTEDGIYALGFSEDAGVDDEKKDRHTEFTDLDVVIYKGEIQDKQANKNGILYLQHSAKINDGNTGGPLLNGEGYVIGINNKVLSEKEADCFFSLPIDGVRNVLDNFQVPYGNKEKDQLTKRYIELLDECKALETSKVYNNKSKVSLQEILQDTEMLDPSQMEGEEIQKEIQLLEGAKAKLKKKMTMTRKIIIVLALLIVVLAVWLIRLLLWRKKIGGKSQNTSDNCKEKTVILGPISKSFSNYHKEDTVRDRREKAVICCVRTGQSIFLDKPETYFGNKEELNDFAFPDNKAISKKHACIRWENGQYYIMDLRSANGTFVNGTQVSDKMTLTDGDNVVLADERFIFKIEE